MKLKLDGVILVLSARFLFAALIAVTSFYCLLTYIPFTYIHFLQFTHFTWLAAFVKLHSWLYWLCLLLVILTLVPDLKRPSTKWLTVMFLAVQLPVGVFLLARPLLSNVKNDISSLVLSLISLIPLLWLTAIDYVGSARELKWVDVATGDGRRVFIACASAAFFSTALFFGVFYARYQGGAGIAFGGPEKAVALVWSAIAHLIVFSALFVILSGVRGLASLINSLVPKPGFESTRLQFFLCTLLWSLLTALAIKKIILAAISFVGGEAWLFSLAMGFSAVTFSAGVGLRLQRQKEKAVTSGLGVTLRSIVPLGIKTRPGRCLWIAALSILAYLFLGSIASIDWNFLVQKLVVLTVWVFSFAGFYAMAHRQEARTDRPIALMASAVLVLVGYRAVEGSGSALARSLTAGKVDIHAAIERYAGYEVSFKIVREILAPPQVDAGGLYTLLQRNANIPRSTPVNPVEYKIVENLSATSEEKPNVFVVVIDSLRQDYLSPYNQAIDFTPEIGSFARESIVMENAFSRYGATGLSEPSIWAGGMLLHKQYITPFYPMNSLQKLIETEGYQSYISLDTILRVVVKPSQSITELDESAQDKNYDLCHSLKELADRLDQRVVPDKPIFAYTQPQNIHISVITREGKTVPPGESYPGFYAPYASRIRRMDACFGEFIAFLKSRGLYDKSIVVLTADHGDSLGEEGRWGHAYTIFPEVLRVPLIIHLPPELRSRVQWDPQAIAFSSDITPSLYYLLGHKPIAKNGIYGRPLFTTTRQELSDYQEDSYLVSSSYGAVFGLLKDNGRNLYIADGVNYTDYYFDLADDPKGTRNRASASIKSEYGGLIRQKIEELARFYQFSRSD